MTLGIFRSFSLQNFGVDAKQQQFCDCVGHEKFASTKNGSLKKLPGIHRGFRWRRLWANEFFPPRVFH